MTGVIVASPPSEWLAVPDKTWHGVLREDGGPVYGLDGYTPSELVDLVVGHSADYDQTKLCLGRRRRLFGWHLVELVELDTRDDE